MSFNNRNNQIPGRWVWGTEIGRRGRSEQRVGTNVDGEMEERVEVEEE